MELNFRVKLKDLIFNLIILLSITFLMLQIVDCAHPCNGWILHETKDSFKCYKYLHVGTNYETAQKYCHSKGSTLLMIKSEAEHEFITNLMKEEFNLRVDLWLGMKWDHSSEEFLWDDGSKVEYTKWSIGEPNQVNQTESCVEIIFWENCSPDQYSKWNDRSCLDMNVVVCEKSIPYDKYKCTQESTETVVEP